MTSEMKITDHPISLFFANSGELDVLALRPLSHIDMSWELTWDHGLSKYNEDESPYAKYINNLLLEIANTNVPSNYHDNEDVLAQYVVEHLKWPIQKVKNRWIGADYESILAQGGFNDLDEQNLIKACAGRVYAAIDRAQFYFDEMEESHKKMLATVFTVIIYHRFKE